MKATSLLFFVFFVLTLNFYGQGYLVTYPLEPGASVSSNYTVFVNGTQVNVTKVGLNNDISYAHFSFAGTVTVRVHIPSSVTGYTLSPWSYNISSVVSGQDITFDLNKPRKLLIDNVNSISEALCILADPLEDNIPVPNGTSVVDATTKSIDKTGATDNLSQIQTAYNNLPSDGILYFPTGKYTAGGTINMASNKSIYLAGGATIQANTASSGGELSFNFDGASSAKIYGRGALDANGDLKRASYNGEGGTPLITKSNGTTSDLCTIDGVILKEAIAWNAIPNGATNWTVYNIKVLNGAMFGNHDGWDPHNNIGLMFDNNFVFGSDDCIAMSTTLAVGNVGVTFRNNVLANKHSGATIRIGPWIYDGTSNITAENNDHLISGTNEYALAFWIGGDISNIKYNNNRVQNAQFGLILMRTSWNDFYAGPQTGSVNGVTFDRLTATNVSPNAWDGHKSQLEGPNSTSYVSNIAFKSFSQGGTAITSNTVADMVYTGSNVTNVSFATSTTPVIEITATTLTTTRGSGTTGKFTVTRTGGSTASALTVNYKIHGNAVNGTDYTTISGSVTIPAGASSATITITPSATNSSTDYRTVFLSLTSSSGYMLGANYDAVVTIINSTVTCTLPSGWSVADVNGVTGQSSCESGGTFTIMGGGADISGTTDSFRFTYKSLTGDGSIVAKINSIQNTDPWAKSGVMIRESTAAGSTHASCFVTPSNGIEFMTRATTNAVAVGTAVAGNSAPYWVKIQRAGNNFSAFRSADGVTWIQVSTTTAITMASSIQIGLAVTSHNTSSLCTSSISNVTISNGAIANMLVNPGIESALTTGWNEDWGRSSQSTTFKRTGTYSLKIAAGTTSGGRAQSVSSGFTVGNQYTLSAYSRLSATSTANFKIGVLTINSAGGTISNYSSGAITSTSFTQVYVTFNVDPGTTVIKVYAYSDASSVDLYCDDFLLATDTQKSARIELGNISLPVDEEVVVYPNPASDMVFIKNVKPNSRVQIFSLDGKMVALKTFTDGNENNMDVSKLKKGIYFVNIQNTESNITKKVVIE